jgi:hypothetical protein
LHGRTRSLALVEIDPANGPCRRIEASAQVVRRIARARGPGCRPASIARSSELDDRRDGRDDRDRHRGEHQLRLHQDSSERAGESALGPPREREHEREPGVGTPLCVVEPLAQSDERALQPAVHGRRGDALAARDLARRQGLEEAQQDRRAVGFLELEDGEDDLLLHARARDELVRRVELLAARGTLFALATPRLAPAAAVQETPHDRRQPSTHRMQVVRSMLQRYDQRVLREVLGAVPIGRHVASESADPPEVGDQRLARVRLVRLLGHDCT